jgi:hypothetical protein
MKKSLKTVKAVYTMQVGSRELSPVDSGRTQSHCCRDCVSFLFLKISLAASFIIIVKAKAVPLHATKALGNRGSIASTHS